jgi:hypothetical protein
METMVQQATGVKVLTLHHDISTVTREEVVLFTLAEPPRFRKARKKQPFLGAGYFREPRTATVRRRTPPRRHQFDACKNWRIFRSSSPVRRAWIRMCITATSHCASL